METFAFTQVAVNFEDPGPAPEFRTLDLNLKLPAAGVVGSAAALSLITAAPDAHAVVRRGDFCAAVGAVQSALAELNYAPGGIDNNFGIFTERAVQNFQRNNDISPDGMVGPATAAALGLPPGPYAVGAGCNGGGGGGGGEGLATVTADVLNVRSGPAVTSPVVGELFRGTQVQVLRTLGDWSEISSTAAGEAWVSSAYLSGGSVVTPPVVDPGLATVTADVLNIRAQPAITAPVIGELFQGTQVQVLRTSGSWSEISSSAAGEAWVASTYLSTVSSGSGSGGGGSIISTDSGNGANVRAFPDGPRVYGLPEGAVVRLNGVTRSVDGTSWSQLTDGNWIVSFVLN